jgi:hypothetical protein
MLKRVTNIAQTVDCTNQMLIEPAGGGIWRMFALETSSISGVFGDF